jgi:hypothetical protein
VIILGSLFRAILVQLYNIMKAIKPCVSVLMHLCDGEEFLPNAISSVLQQPECLELLIADVGFRDACQQQLEILVAIDPRLRIVSVANACAADVLNQAFRQARGTLIGWFSPDDLYLPGALERAISALEKHPNWLMVYGECDQFNATSSLTQRYLTLPPNVGLDAFRSHSFISRPTVVFRRTMVLLLGSFNSNWCSAFDVDYYMRAFEAFPHRIGYIPHLQARTRLPSTSSTNLYWAQVALDITKLQAHKFGASDGKQLDIYALERYLGGAEMPGRETFVAHLSELFEQAAPWLEIQSLAKLRSTWLEGASHRLQDEPCRWRSSASVKPAATLIPFAQRPFGVNLIGHAFEVFGIGEDIRMAALALQAAGIPCSVINHPARNGAAGSDRSLEPLLISDPIGGPYAFNLVCMAATSQTRWLLQNGLDPLRERYTISCWPWETMQWPKPWLSLLEVADELWPASSFTAEALRRPAAESGLPLHVMPMAAEIPNPDRFRGTAARLEARERHGLPIEAMIFCYGFDLNSTAARKNPIAVLEAFQLAFPLPHLPSTFGRQCKNHPHSEQVALLIKAFPPRGFSADWHWLQARAMEDSRIHLIAESLERDRLVALYGSCDVFLSLHRSEGYGRGIAEALQLGLDVIATNYGGNTDFCNGPLAHPVRYQLVPIPRGAYPCADGHSWAEPDLQHAAELMHRVAARRLGLASAPTALISQDPSRDPAVFATYHNRFSCAAAGQRYRQRLEQLWEHRYEIGHHLKWRSDTPV